MSHFAPDPLPVHTSARLVDMFSEMKVKKWSKWRIKSWITRFQQPSNYYYRHVDPQFALAMGKWSKQEHERFMNRLKEFKSKNWKIGSNWGIFSRVLPHRCGYQCSNYYRKLITDGYIKDSDYGYDDTGRFRQISDNKTGTGLPPSENVLTQWWSSIEAAEMVVQINEWISQYHPNVDLSSQPVHHRNNTLVNIPALRTRKRFHFTSSDNPSVTLSEQFTQVNSLSGSDSDGHISKSGSGSGSGSEYFSSGSDDDFDLVDLPNTQEHHALIQNALNLPIGIKRRTVYENSQKNQVDGNTVVIPAPIVLSDSLIQSTPIALIPPPPQDIDLNFVISPTKRKILKSSQTESKMDQTPFFVEESLFCHSCLFPSSETMILYQCSLCFNHFHQACSPGSNSVCSECSSDTIIVSSQDSTVQNLQYPNKRSYQDTPLSSIIPPLPQILFDSETNASFDNSLYSPSIVTPLFETAQKPSNSSNQSDQSNSFNQIQKKKMFDQGIFFQTEDQHFPIFEKKKKKGQSPVALIKHLDSPSSFPDTKPNEKDPQPFSSKYFPNPQKSPSPLKTQYLPQSQLQSQLQSQPQFQPQPQSKSELKFRQSSSPSAINQELNHPDSPIQSEKTHKTSQYLNPNLIQAPHNDKRAQQNPLLESKDFSITNPIASAFQTSPRSTPPPQITQKSHKYQKDISPTKHFPDNSFTTPSKLKNASRDVSDASDVSESTQPENISFQTETHSTPYKRRIPVDLLFSPAKKPKIQLYQSLVEFKQPATKSFNRENSILPYLCPYSFKGILAPFFDIDTVSYFSNINVKPILTSVLQSIRFAPLLASKIPHYLFHDYSNPYVPQFYVFLENQVVLFSQLIGHCFRFFDSFKNLNDLITQWFSILSQPISIQPENNPLVSFSAHCISLCQFILYFYLLSTGQSCSFLLHTPWTTDSFSPKLLNDFFITYFKPTSKIELDWTLFAIQSGYWKFPSHWMVPFTLQHPHLFQYQKYLPIGSTFRQVEKHFLSFQTGTNRVENQTPLLYANSFSPSDHFEYVFSFLSPLLQKQLTPNLLKKYLPTIQLCITSAIYSFHFHHSLALVQSCFSILPQKYISNLYDSLSSMNVYQIQQSPFGMQFLQYFANICGRESFESSSSSLIFPPIVFETVSLQEKCIQGDFQSLYCDIFRFLCLYRANIGKESKIAQQLKRASFSRFFSVASFGFQISHSNIDQPPNTQYFLEKTQRLEYFKTFWIHACYAMDKQLGLGLSLRFLLYRETQKHPFPSDLGSFHQPSQKNPDLTAVYHPNLKLWKSFQWKWLPPIFLSSLDMLFFNPTSSKQIAETLDFFFKFGGKSDSMHRLLVETNPLLHGVSRLFSTLGEPKLDENSSPKPFYFSFGKNMVYSIQVKSLPLETASSQRCLTISCENPESIVYTPLLYPLKQFPFQIIQNHLFLSVAQVRIEHFFRHFSVSSKVFVDFFKLLSWSSTIPYEFSSSESSPLVKHFLENYNMILVFILDPHLLYILLSPIATRALFTSSLIALLHALENASPSIISIYWQAFYTMLSQDCCKPDVMKHLSVLGQYSNLLRKDVQNSYFNILSKLPYLIQHFGSPNPQLLRSIVERLHGHDINNNTLKHNFAPYFSFVQNFNPQIVAFLQQHFPHTFCVESFTSSHDPRNISPFIRLPIALNLYDLTPEFHLALYISKLTPPPSYIKQLYNPPRASSSLHIFDPKEEIKTDTSFGYLL